MAKKHSTKHGSSGLPEKQTKRSANVKHQQPEHPTLGATFMFPHSNSHAPPSNARKRRPIASRVLACIATATFVAVIILGAFCIVGCTSTKVGINNLHILEFTANTTYDIRLRVGYFGGCLSIAGIDGGDIPAAALGKNASSGPRTHCIMNLHDKDVDDLAEEFQEDIRLTEDAALNNTLNLILPFARHLQVEVFHWGFPVAHSVLFLIGGIMALTSLAGASHSRHYKSVLLAAAILGAFSLAMAISIAGGLRQALNAVVGGDGAKQAHELAGEIFIRRANHLFPALAILAGLTAFFYLVVGILLVRR